MDKAESGHKIPMRTFWKCSEYHVWIAICAYLIVATVKYTLKSTLSTYEIMQVLGISVFDKTPLKDLIAQDQKIKAVKEQNLLNLFDAKS